MEAVLKKKEGDLATARSEVAAQAEEASARLQEAAQCHAAQVI